MKDLVVLVADRDMEATIRTLLGKRPSALGIRAPEADVFVHPERDPGVYRRGDSFLSTFSRTHQYALVMFDYHGCGRENLSVDALREDLKKRLETRGWSCRCEVIVINPELEVWVWAKSPHFAKVLGLTREEVQRTLEQFPPTGGRAGKPNRPKEAFEACLQKGRIPRSASLYRELAAKVSLARCADPAFARLRDVLRSWFPPGDPGM